MSTQADKDYAAMQAKAITQIANVSRLLRDAINASLPVAPEQYLTVAIPGTTIDTRDIKDGGTFVYDAETTAFAPMQVQQAEGKLVDNMIPLSTVMLGNTGKSVARSYDRALDTLVAKKATIGTGSGQIRSPGEKTYDTAMEYLTKVDDATGLTPVDTYIEKQRAWADAQDAWDKAKLKAKKDAETAYPKDTVMQTQNYNEWNQANYRKYKFAVQGRYMDWVANGHKYEVEANFGIVDVDSIMERIEMSKESVRNSTIVDADGSNEVQLVDLTPKNWATLCKQKSEGWFARNGDYSIDQLDAEIARLQRLLVSYQAMEAAMGVDPVGKLTYPINEDGVTAPDVKTADTNMKSAFSDLYAKQAAVNLANQKLREAKTDEDKKTAEATLTTANDALDTSRKALSTSIDANQDAHADYTKFATASLSDDATKAAVTSWMTGTVSQLESNIKSLQDKRVEKLKQTQVSVPVISGASSSDGSTGTMTATPGSEQPDPVFGVGDTGASSTGETGNATDGKSSNLPQAGTVSDPWVTITASFSAQDQSSTTTTSSWGMSVGGGAGWGLWSVGGSYSHDQSSSDTVSDMASCDVSVTFSALVVNVNRPWLYGELFSDAELDCADGIMLSPGPSKLHELIMAQKGSGNDPNSFDSAVVDELAQYSSFPAYPTSFVVAADTTVEFNGNTQHVEKHFSAESNAGSASVGWGPFSVSSSFHQSSSKQSFQCQSTATGCKLTFGAPQIIGWVSQILPALPRPKGYEPMVQNNVTVKS